MSALLHPTDSPCCLLHPLPFVPPTPLQVSCALWVLAEYSATPGEVEAALEVIHAGIGPLPLLQVVSGG